LYTAAWLIHFRIQNDLDQQRFRLTDSPIIQPVVRVYHLDAAIKPSQKEQISGLISIIKHKIPTVEAILYLGSQPAAEHQLFLLVLTTDNEQQTALSLSNTIEESCRKITAVTALVHYSSAFIKALNEGNQFFKKALSCPVIYLSGDLLLPVAGPLFHLPNHDTAVQWERWHGQGKDFLKGAEYYLRINAYGAALFSMHQCVEYLLVAIIRVVLGYGLNVHNLSKLLSITRMFTNDLFIVFNFEDEQSAALFRMLKDAYIDVRYRDTFDPDITSLDTLYRVTKHFVETVEKVYERHLLSESL
jgi:HEPN domain-containing protein